MKRLVLLLFLVCISLPQTAEARRFRPLRQRNNGAGIFKYWSPGIGLGLIGQNRGPRMEWRGDWVPRNR